MLLDGDGAEVDWSVGYRPPAENFQKGLDKMLAGDGTFKALTAAYAKNPKDIATVFGLARKYGDRYDTAKAGEKYKEVIALDPEGKAGAFTHQSYKVTVPYAEFAEFAIARDRASGRNPDLAPLRAFLVKRPQSKLVRQAYESMQYYYAYQAPKDEASKFFEEYASKFPSDPMVLFSWLLRIVRDKEPIDKGVELASKIEEMTEFNPSPNINQLLAQAYALKGDKAKADELYGKTFMEDRVSGLAFSLAAYSAYWLEQSANQESAVAMVETALKLEPENSYIIQQAANAYLKTGQEDKALAVYGSAYAKRNAADATALWQYAGFWTRQGKNLNDALAAAKSAVELMPGAYYLWNSLGQVYEKMKNYPEAIKAAEKAVELAPESAKATFKKNVEKLKTEAQGKK